MNQTTTPLDGTGGKNPPQGSTAKKPRERKRRNYAAELADLQGRVDMAVKLLKKCDSNTRGETDTALITVALETLAGE